MGALVGGWLGTTVGLRPTLVVAGLGGALAVTWLPASPVRGITSLDEYSTERELDPVPREPTPGRS